MVDFICDLSSRNNDITRLKEEIERLKGINMDSYGDLYADITKLEKENERLKKKYERLEEACYEFINMVGQYREGIYQESILMRHKLRKIGEEK